MRGGQDRLLREHNELAWLAYHIVALGRMKRLLKLERLYVKQATPGRRRQNWQEQFAIMGQWIKAVEARSKNGGMK